MRNLDYPVDQACPHDGWYNGNPNLMITNGTFLDYRHRLVEWVRKGKMTQAALDLCDKRWKAMPLAVKKERRNAVIEATKKVAVKQRDGKIDYVSKPSDNGYGANEEKKPALRRSLTQRMPLGSIATRANPLDAEEAAMLPSSELEGEGLGHSVPESVPSMHNVTAPVRQLASVL